MSNKIGYEIDFLPVGEGEKCGDAIALRWGNLLSSDPAQQVVVIIDGGFVESGETLVEHIVKYYHTNKVDCIISTHPHNDHVPGLCTVLEKLNVDCLAMHLPWNHACGISDWFKDGRVTDNSVKEKLKEGLEFAYQLEQLAKKKKIKIVEPFEGVCGYDRKLRIIGPTENYYESLLPGFKSTPEPKKAMFGENFLKGIASTISKIAEDWGIETLDDNGETSAENNSSVITLFNFNDEYCLFTGDAGIPALNGAISLLELEDFDFQKLKFIQVPHHGSQRNIGPSILNKIIRDGVCRTKIKTAFVSVAKDGAPKHPAKKVTNAFLRRGAPVYSTQGVAVRHSHNAPDRSGWTTAQAIPFFNEVDE